MLPAERGEEKTDAADVASQSIGVLRDAQLAEKPAATLPGASGRTFSDAAKDFGDLVPVLIAGDREKAQEGRMDGNPRLIPLLLC
jgi:hypothetical protein